MKRKGRMFFAIGLGLGMLCSSQMAMAAEMGSFKYEDFKKPTYCAGCHKAIAQEWKQSMMSQSFTHGWDEVEYFKLALPHAEKLAKVAGVKAGCIGCHSPIAFLSGDIPPKPVADGTRANEGVSCEVCHHITGTTEAEPFNFSFTIEPGKTMQGPRKDAKSPVHKVHQSAFTTSSKLCATCHDEQSPYGAWVKSTYREWKAGPYAKEGTRCQDCHMYDSPGKAAKKGVERDDVAHHVFHGSHFASKLAGAVDLALYSGKTSVAAGEVLGLRAELFNGKVGHYIPSGSSEERMLWLEMQGTDSSGKTFTIPVEQKGFTGEEYTIADSKAIAYQAMGEIMEVKDWKGISRDGNVPDGSRIFRRPFFDPEGRMTICQWFTAENTAIDYRIGPRESKVERYQWTVPAEAAAGKMKIEAKLFYSQVPSSVGEYMGLDADEYAAIKVNEASLSIDIKK